jgi:tetratricopeptide (TPR) repeat protein
MTSLDPRTQSPRPGVSRGEGQGEGLSRNDRALAWAVAMLAAALAAYVACYAVMDTDIWWHLAAGRVMVEERRWIFADPFAADTLGRPWVDVHWLFQVLVYLLHRWGGIAALVVAKIALIGLGVGLGVRSLCARLARPLWLPAAVTVVAMLYPARHLMLARPTVFTLVAMTLMLLIVERARREDRLRWAFLLVPVQVVWANLQGLYFLGPAILACFVVGDAAAAWLARQVSRPARVPSRRVLLGLAALLPVMVLSSAITPYGFHGLRLPLVLFGRIDAVAGQVFSREVSENIAPWLLERATPGELSAFKWLAAFTFLSFLPAFARGFAALPKLCFVTLFFVLALLANRNILLFLWIAGPILAENLAVLVPAAFARDRGNRWLRRGLALGAAFGLVALGWGRMREARGEPPIGELAPFRVPEQAVDRFLALGLPAGPIFCSDRYGGYLAWRLYPRSQPTMDGRLVLRSAQGYAEHLALGEHPEDFDAYRRRHGIRTVILPSAYPDRFLPLVGWLYRQPSWRLLYTDGTQTLFALDEEGVLRDHELDLTAPQTVRAILAELETRYGLQPIIHDRARLHLARLLAEIGATGPAEELLAALPGTTAAALRARVAYLAGDRARAEAMAKSLLASQPNEIESLCLLALLSRERGDPQRALSLVQQALEVDPFHPLATQILDQIRRDLATTAR